MSDSPCGLSSDLLIATLTKYGDLTAYELAHLLRVSLKQVLCVTSHEWWTVQPVTWDGPGWKYRLRTTISKHLAKPINRDRQYENAVGTMIPGGYHT